MPLQPMVDKGRMIVINFVSVVAAKVSSQFPLNALCESEDCMSVRTRCENPYETDPIESVQICLFWPALQISYLDLMGRADVIHLMNLVSNSSCAIFTI